MKTNKIINGHGYIGQYADKYYLLKVYSFQSLIVVYDLINDKVKTLRVRNEKVRINHETISVYLLNG